MAFAKRPLPAHTPMHYLAAMQGLRRPYLLESAGGPAEITGASYLGAEPHLTFVAHGRSVAVDQDGGTVQREGDPFGLLQELLHAHAVAPAAGVPPLCGAVVGYLGYDIGRVIERLPEQATDDMGLPDICLHLHRWCVEVTADAAALHVLGETPAAAEAEADRLAAWLTAAVARVPAQGVIPAATEVPAVVGRTFDRGKYEAAVRRVLAYIAAGDVYQVNLAQRFTVAPAPAPLDLYRRLRASNPAPFAAYMEGNGFALVSSSPERLLKVQHRPAGLWVETRPIKGTRPRGATPAETVAQTADLLASEKDAAELAMIVDLQRNDLGRVCRFGSVRVTQARRVETYPSVLHTVATVEGMLRPGVGVGDLLRATLPGGSITGAPKVRAMEIIEELEPVRRGPYCGCMGYLSFTGEVDLNIAIRTVVLKDRQAHLHAGGGIVADSQPGSEYEETLVKARALLGALGIPAFDPQVSEEVRA